MVNKKIVLNVCGVKSLGGLKLFLESFDYFAESGNNLIVLYSELPFYKAKKIFTSLSKLIFK